MKKMLNLLAVVSLVSSSSVLAVACTPRTESWGKEDNYYETGENWIGKGEVDSLVKSKSIKNTKSSDVLWTDYSKSTLKSFSSESNDRTISTLATKDVLNVQNESFKFSPYADMGIVEDTAEYLLKDKGKSGAYKQEAIDALKKKSAKNIIYNDLGEISKNSEVVTNDTEITLGFMQNASDTGDLVPMWNAAPSKLDGKGILADKGDETEYAQWFNDRFRKWTEETKSDSLNKQNLRISFGPFANSLWHTAWQNNKTPEQLANIIEKISERYGTKKFDFYFAAPYLSAKGDYADSQKLLASALKILIEKDSSYDVQLSLVMSTKDGVAFNSELIDPQTGKLQLEVLGDEGYPLYNFTKYLGLNFRLNLVTGYLTYHANQKEENWELPIMQEGVQATQKNWIKIHNALNNTNENEKDHSKKIKITPWIGRRAELAKYNFTPEDSVNLRNWAKDKGYGGVGMFYISRDVPSEFMDNKEEANANADKNPLDQNIRSGSGFEQFTYAKALNGTLNSNDVPKVEKTSKEDILKLGGIDYDDQIKAVQDLNNLGGTTWESEWEGPSVGGGAGGAGSIGVAPEIPTGPGKSLYTDWASANPNRKSNIVKKAKENKNIYFSPYIDAGLYQGNNVSDIRNNVGNNFNHLTLAFVQQVNKHGDYLDLSIAGQENVGEGFDWWEQSQFWNNILKPMAESNNFKNVKVAYGGATTGGYTEKNPWTLANTLAKTKGGNAQEMLKDALIGYQQSLVDLAQRNKFNVEMPKAIDFDIEGHAQELDEDNRLLARTLAEMKKNDSSWDFSITLPVLPSGLTSVGYKVMDIFVEEYQKAGLSQKDIPVVNLMLMDYGDPIYVAARDNEKITNFELARRAVNATKNNLATSIEKRYGSVKIGNSGLYKLIGATPMIGVNDTVHGVFTLEDAKELYNWSHTMGLAYIGIWSMNDDRGRDIYSKKPVNKSLITHGLGYLEEYDFARAFAGNWTNGVKKPKSKV